MPFPSTYNVVVFAHNEAARIARCLHSVLSQQQAGLQHLYVLINGCTDNTAEIVTQVSDSHPQVTGVVLDEADKAASWNHYIHHLSAGVSQHVFVDGDIYLTDGALGRLVIPIQVNPDILATAAVPPNGRSKMQWQANMQRWGRLAGALYGLSDLLVNELREEGISLPKGIVGEDFLVTCLVKGSIEFEQLFVPSPRLLVVPEATFGFDGLRWTSPHHWRIGLRRLLRYQIREHQLKLLFHYMQHKAPAQMPVHIKQLYTELSYLIRYQYRGRNTLVDWLAVRHMKRGG